MNTCRSGHSDRRIGSGEVDGQLLQSEGIRRTSAESDCLHYGMGWNTNDLGKPHVMIESCYGDSHPGSSHLLTLSGHARDGVMEAGGRPCTFVVTDMCDGIAQGSLGNSYSLLSRDYMASMVEIQARSTMCDGLVLLSSCDKSVPAHLIAAARLDLPTVFMPGGSMAAGASLSCCDKMWDVRRKTSAEANGAAEFDAISQEACPTAGACQQFGTAGTMQAMVEALGLALPGTAVLPMANNAILRAARNAGRQVLDLMEKGITARKILTRKAFENAITVHAAIGGSANAIVHMIAAAREAGVDISVKDFDRINRYTPYLTNTLSTGKYPTEYFWYAGGIPELMLRIKDLLHLDVLTATGRTLGENLDAWQASRGTQRQQRYLANYNISPEDVISDRSNPRSKDGGLAILYGNIAPGGSIVKHSAVRPEMMRIRGKAHVFRVENDAIAALARGEIHPGEIIVVIGQGPRANGMPEIFRLGDIIAMNPVLEKTVAVITDGRYSGCTKGPAIGYVCPEAAADGPIGLLKTGDIIEVDIPNRSMNLVEGLDQNGNPAPGDQLILERKGGFHMEAVRGTGALALYRNLAQQALDGGSMRIGEEQKY